MISEKLNYLIKSGGLSQKEVGEKFGIIPQQMNRKVKRESFKIRELIQLAELVGCEIHFVSKKTKETIVKLNENDLD